MRILIASDYADMSRTAAGIIADQLRCKPASVLGLATGTTPIDLYDILAADCAAGFFTFSQATTFNLDEYRGIAGTHPQSYRYFMDHQLFSRVDIDMDRTHVPDGADLDSAAACAAYERQIEEAGRIDLQLLGLGINGHVGFNEPADDFPVRTHCVDLTDSTIQANSRLFDSIDDVPRQAYTMGIGTIMKARSILLVASGANKAQAAYDALFGPVVPRMPASVLQLHPHVTAVLDEQAASLVKQVL